MLYHSLHGVADYDWSKWPSTAFPLTDDLKNKAAAIADKFTSAADADKYMAESTDPLNLKVVVQYAATAKTKPAFTPTFTSSASPEPVRPPPQQEPPPPPPPVEEKKETPWLLYAVGAVILYMLFNKKKGGSDTAKD